MASKTGSGISGYRYYMSLLTGLSRGPIDELKQINVDTTLIAWQGSLTDDTANTTIDRGNLFGGDEKEGGIRGSFRLMMGKPTQVVPDAIKTVITGLVSGFRGVVTIFYNGEISANSPYPKAWSFRAHRTLKGWQDDTVWNSSQCRITLTSDIAGSVIDPTGDSPGGYIQTPENPAGVQTGSPTINAMNPAHIIYECITNRVWGRGLPTALIDEVQFANTAAVLVGEGFGLCLAYNQGQPLNQFIQTVIDHVSGVVYVDRRSGLFVFKLLRGDYNVDSLPTFDMNSGLLQIQEDASTTSQGLPNEVIVKWHDPVLNNDLSVRAQNIAAMRAAGAIISVTVAYPGLPTNDLASRVALRDIAVRSTDLKKLTIVLDRAGAVVQPGDVFRITDLTRGFDKLVLRAGKITEAPMSDGKITIEAVQDVFTMPATGFTPAQPTTWVRPNNRPNPSLQRAPREATYRDLCQYLRSSDLAALEVTSAFFIMAAGRPQYNPTSAGFELWTEATGATSYRDAQTAGWCGTGEIQSAIGEYDTSITLEGALNTSSIVVPGAALIEGEWVKVTAFDLSTNIATIARGCVDTVPVKHAADADVWFCERYQAVDTEQYVTSEVINAKVLTITTTDLLDLTTADVDSVTMIGRQNLPYVPGLLKVNGVPFASIVTTVPGDQVFTWARRNRLTQADTLVDHTTADIAPESGQTVTIRVYSYPSGTLVRTESGITGTSFTYTTVMQGADGVGDRVTIELEAVRDGYASFTKYSFRLTLIAHGWGYDWGFDWGGNP